MDFVVQAALVALVNAWFRTNGGWPSSWETALCQFWGSWIIGWICGDIRTGLIVGGLIQTINLVPIFVGGVFTMDLWFACAVAIPLVTRSGLETAAAVALAAPLGVFGSFVLATRQVVVSDMWVVPYVRRLAQRGDTRMIGLVNNVFAPAANVALGGVFVFLSVYLGTSAANLVVNEIPESVLSGFTAVGGLLPAVGVVMFLALLGDKRHLPFYFIGYYLCLLAGLTTIEVAILVTAFACVLLFNRIDTEKKIERAVSESGTDF